jgi:hypothetical protein
MMVFGALYNIGEITIQGSKITSSVLYFLVD